jgi:putative transposase
MKQVLTVACKIKVMPEQLAKVQETFQVFADAYEYVNQEGSEKLTNGLAMQSLVYHEVRARFGLSAQLAIHAIRRVSGNRKTAKSKGEMVKQFALGRSINRSGGSGLACSKSDHVLGLLKTPPHTWMG